MAKTEHTPSERIDRLLRAHPELSLWCELTVHRVDWRPHVREAGDVFDGGLTVEMGYRWNPAGVRTIYGSLEPETALAEAEARRRAFGGKARRGAPDPPPLFWLHLVAEPVLDLTAEPSRRALGLGEEDLLSPINPWGALSATQAIGLAAFEREFAGLLVPSARTRRGINAVLFADRLGPGAFGESGRGRRGEGE